MARHVLDRIQTKHELLSKLYNRNKTSTFSYSFDHTQILPNSRALSSHSPTKEKGTPSRGLPSWPARALQRGRGHWCCAFQWVPPPRMPRKPKRVRDPDRSHAKGKAVAPVPRLLPRSGAGTVMSGPGWSMGKVSDDTRRSLLRALAATSLKGPAWHEHSKPGEQGNDLPMLQRWLSRQANWKPLVEEVIAGATVACPCCGDDVSNHVITAADLNMVRPQAAVWPHHDQTRHGCGLLVLLKAAQMGGHFRIASEPDAAWREARAGGLTWTRRARDAVYVPLAECGDVCCFDGRTHSHEVSRVHGSEPRITLSITLGCGRGRRPSVTPPAPPTQ